MTSEPITSDPVLAEHYKRVTEAYNGSSGELTKAIYSDLIPLGPKGAVGLNLFRACKCSARAKKYRGGTNVGGEHRSFKDLAYERKHWSVTQLSETLTEHAEALGIEWGWAIDQAERGPNFHVLYVDLPTGQVSFHGPLRMIGPDYTKPWDGVRHAAGGRICRYVATVLRDRP